MDQAITLGLAVWTSDWLSVYYAISVSEITMSMFYSADAYQCKRPISVGDPCIALCKGFQKACEMLQAEIWKTF